jgi:CheY-like chemotaxis protein/two-component sensor histidine kinase
MVQTDLAKLTIPADNPVQENLDEIMKAGHRAKDLVGQILAFSRQSAQQRISMNLTPMIKESLKLLRSSIPTTIEIRQDIEGGPCPVWADPTQMQQIVMNLCTNASHAMQETGGVLEVDLKTVALGTEAAKAYPNIGPGRYVMLTVSDTGVGIEPELMEKIFDPFFTTKPVNEGTGMGLSVVHGIVRSHEGDITVRSDPGKGATFSVLLPRLEGKAKVETVVRNGSVPTGSERILFVDDEETVVKVGEQMLKKLGYHVESTTQAVEALAAFREQPDRYDLVITDMTMPNMTGDELTRQLKAIQPDIPIIICTGFSERINEEKAEAMGVKGFLMKPIGKSELTQLVRTILDGRGLQG